MSSTGLLTRYDRHRSSSAGVFRTRRAPSRARGSGASKRAGLRSSSAGDSKTLPARIDRPALRIKTPSVFAQRSVRVTRWPSCCAASSARIIKAPRQTFGAGALGTKRRDGRRLGSRSRPYRHHRRHHRRAIYFRRISFLQRLGSARLICSLRVMATVARLTHQRRRQASSYRFWSITS